jgi:MoaA/NifB/PqqE/SkfB family radical SAM enzyme
MNIEHTRMQGLDFSRPDIEAAVDGGSLLSIDLEFSRRCNLRCIYCYAMSGDALKNELTFEEITLILRQAVDLGIRNVVNIGGGEPLMYPRYWDVLAFERQYSLRTVTFTNGTLVDRDVARRLYDLRENIALKFNSFDGRVQDRLAGKKGTARKIKAALDHLREAGYATENGPSLALETIVCRQNYGEIEEIYAFCRENNILPYVEILTVQGTARRYAAQLAITPDEGFRLYSRLQQYDRDRFSIEWPLTPPIAGQSCRRILYSAYITATGNVQPCPGIDVTTPDSNLRNRDLAWIINHSAVFRDARNIYKRLKGPCRDCEHTECYGCRGNALSCEGDYLASDPACWWGKG